MFDMFHRKHLTFLFLFRLKLKCSGLVLINVGSVIGSIGPSMRHCKYVSMILA